MTPWNPPSPHYRITVRLAIGALLLLMSLAVMFPERITDAPALLASCTIALLLSLMVVAVSTRLPLPWRVALRALGVVALVSFLFDAVAGVQHLLFQNWFDTTLIHFETMFTGIESSLWLEQFIHPGLTEWLMLSYVIYVPLIPFTAWVCYRYGNEAAVYEYIFALLSVNLLCDLGFVLFPIASQLFIDPAQYSIPLQGGPFTAMSEWMRTNQHYAGGSFPSPHNAAGTVMLLSLWRYSRRWGLALAPFLLSIPLATVYGRFHYVSDGLAGIILAVVIVRIAASLRALPSALTATRWPALFYSLKIIPWRMS